MDGKGDNSLKKKDCHLINIGGKFGMSHDSNSQPLDYELCSLPPGQQCRRFQVWWFLLCMLDRVKFYIDKLDGCFGV